MSENAQIYDTSYYNKMRGDDTQDIYKRIVDQFNLEFSGKRVLDVGCGRGEMLSNALSGGAIHVVGCDISPSAIALSRDRLQSRGFDNSMYDLIVLRDGDFLKSIDGEFDTILMIDFVEHWSYPVFVDS
jgi:cyclopropane fatty-acyl-phospholipid synthase-like methyltransferase